MSRNPFLRKSANHVNPWNGEITKLKEQLKSARKNRFGSKKQSVKRMIPVVMMIRLTVRRRKMALMVRRNRWIPVPYRSRKHRNPTPALRIRGISATVRKPIVRWALTEHLSGTCRISKVPGRILDRKLVKTFRLDIRLIEEQFEMVQYVEKGRKPRWGYFPKEGHPQVVTRFDGTKITPGFLQAIAYEVYVKNVTFGLLHQWLGDMGMTVSENTLRNWLKKGRKYLDRMVVELKRIALEKDAVVNCDETWCKVRKYDRYKKCYMWVLVNKAERVVIFFYEDGSRGRDVLTNF